jgi:hypothetical protein
MSDSLQNRIRDALVVTFSVYILTVVLAMTIRILLSQSQNLEILLLVPVVIFSEIYAWKSLKKIMAKVET